MTTEEARQWLFENNWVTDEEAGEVLGVEPVRIRDFRRPKRLNNVQIEGLKGYIEKRMAEIDPEGVTMSFADIKKWFDDNPKIALNKLCDKLKINNVKMTRFKKGYYLNSPEIRFELAKERVRLSKHIKDNG